MQLIFVREVDGDKIRAGLVRELPCDREGLRELVSVLMGDHEDSAEVLQQVMQGSVFHEMGARQYMYLIYSVPSRGGVYGAQEWVSNTLDKAMPPGWGAAMLPFMLPLVGAEDSLLKVTDTWGRMKADRAKQPVWHGICVAPMDRLATPLTGYQLNDSTDGPTFFAIH